MHNIARPQILGIFVVENEVQLTEPREVWHVFLCHVGMQVHYHVVLVHDVVHHTDDILQNHVEHLGGLLCGEVGPCHHHHGSSLLIHTRGVDEVVTSNLREVALSRLTEIASIQHIGLLFLNLSIRLVGHVPLLLLIRILAHPSKRRRRNAIIPILLYNSSRFNNHVLVLLSLRINISNRRRSAREGVDANLAFLDDGLAVLVASVGGEQRPGGQLLAGRAGEVQRQQTLVQVEVRLLIN